MENKNTKVENKKVENKKEDAKKVTTENLSNASVFQLLGKQGAKSREDLATKMIEYLHKKGKTINNKGKTIDKPHLLQQISAMVRDINTKKGNSWHTKLKVVEDDTQFKLVPK